MAISRKLHELCYPYIHDHGYLCDFEVVTDELCSQVGMILALLGGNYPDLQHDLERLQPLCWHVNGSVRGRLAILEKDLEWLHERYTHYRAEIEGQRTGFVLPRGSVLAMQLHLSRSSAKKAIRVMIRLEEEGVHVPEILRRFCNLMCNLFFVLAGVVNLREGTEEPAFVSKSYGDSDLNAGY